MKVIEGTEDSKVIEVREGTNTVAIKEVVVAVGTEVEAMVGIKEAVAMVTKEATVGTRIIMQEDTKTEIIVNQKGIQINMIIEVKEVVTIVGNKIDIEVYKVLDGKEETNVKYYVIS